MWSGRLFHNKAHLNLNCSAPQLATPVQKGKERIKNMDAGTRR